MIEFATYYTGSTGNLYAVRSGAGCLLIEAGVTTKRIKMALDYRLSSVCGCLISHRHLDHCQGVKGVMDAGIDCYMTAETAAALGLSGHRLGIIEPRRQFQAGGYQVIAFEAQHDCPGAVGYLVSDGDDKLLFATDTFYVRHRFSGLTHIAVECNYSSDTMAPGLDPERKKRLYSSHFSLDNVEKFLQANDLSRVREIHLLHLSRENSDAEGFKNKIQALTGKPVFVA